jgi:hypothetical protein
VAGPEVVNRTPRRLVLAAVPTPSTADPSSWWMWRLLTGAATLGLGGGMHRCSPRMTGWPTRWSAGSMWGAVADAAGRDYRAALDSSAADLRHVSGDRKLAAEDHGALFAEFTGAAGGPISTSPDRGRER